MAIDIKNLKKVIALMKKQGVLELKTPEIDLKLSPEAFIHTTDSIPTEQPPLNPNAQFTEEQILLWSSPGYAGTAEENIQ